MEQENQQAGEVSNRIKSLEYDLAEMTVENDKLRERVKILASRTPAWPKGYRPHKPNKYNQR
jgi:hypothetical protein